MTAAEPTSRPIRSCSGEARNNPSTSGSSLTETSRDSLLTCRWTTQISVAAKPIASAHQGTSCRRWAGPSSTQRPVTAASAAITSAISRTAPLWPHRRRFVLRGLIAVTPFPLPLHRHGGRPHQETVPRPGGTSCRCQYQPTPCQVLACHVLACQVLACHVLAVHGSAVQ